MDVNENQHDVSRVLSVWCIVLKMPKSLTKRMRNADFQPISSTTYEPRENCGDFIPCGSGRDGVVVHDGR